MVDIDDMGTLGDAVAKATDDLKAKVAVEGTFLPLVVVEAQTELAARTEYDLVKLLADLVLHLALRQGVSPRALLAERLDVYPITDESWWGKAGPELHKVLAARGFEFTDPARVKDAPTAARCSRCGGWTTSDRLVDGAVVCRSCSGDVEAAA